MGSYPSEKEFKDKIANLTKSVESFDSQDDREDMMAFRLLFPKTKSIKEMIELKRLLLISLAYSLNPFNNNTFRDMKLRKQSIKESYVYESRIKLVDRAISITMKLTPLDNIAV